MTQEILSCTERMSVEAIGNIIPSVNYDDQLNDVEMSSLYDKYIENLFGTKVSGECDLADLIGSSGTAIDKNEFDSYLGIENKNDGHLDLGGTLSYIMEHESTSESYLKQIVLSQSVGIRQLQPQIQTYSNQKIRIVHNLEETYRPRYKSDYFTHEGKIRRPRYVTDREGNHFITLQVAPELTGAIRIDWVTIPDELGNRYVMPYKFQQSNESLDVQDTNPIYVPIRVDKTGLMKLYLVLIKSKQDELKILQPLEPFHPLRTAFGFSQEINSRETVPLHPKQLIRKYQLDKSQLTFTYCSLSNDKISYIVHWDTTEYSTTLQEMTMENSKKRKISCPKCSHIFDLVQSDEEGDLPSGQNKRIQSPKQRKKHHLQSATDQRFNE